MHRHAYNGRKLKRDSGPRDLMLRNLATSVILHERVKTTLAKAKEIKPVVERMVTKAKKGDLKAIRALNAYLLDKNATEKLVSELGPLYEKRTGGYTRIVKAGIRQGDAAEMAYIELLDLDKLVKKVEEVKKKTKVEKKTTTKAKSDKSEKKPVKKTKKVEEKK